MRQYRRISALPVLLLLASGTTGSIVGLRWLTSSLLDSAKRGAMTLDDAIGFGAVTGCWLCVGWLLLAVTCTAATAVPGTVGRCCGAAAELVTPWTLRNLGVAGLGLTVVTGPAAAATGSAPIDVGPARATASALENRIGPGWLANDLPPLDRPADGPRVVTVQPGDCLWSIAARALGADATDADIAAAWPRWYATNRNVIGADPNLLQPGQQLTPPTFT